jgi:hypothetical protein
MSVISCKKDYTDLSAINFFIKNSTTKLLSIESSHGILILLELNSNIESPYSKLVWNGNEIEVKDVYSLTLKITPLSYSTSTFLYNPKEKLYSPSFYDSRFIDTKKYQKYIEDEKVWANELYNQKNIFYKTFMLDSTLYGICPDVLSSFEINKNSYKNFLDFFIFSDSNYKDRYTNEEVYSPKKIIDDFFIELFSKTGNYKAGCYLMEYLENSHDFSFFSCFDVKDTKNYGSIEEYNIYLISKAKLLFQLDKLHWIGFKHNDLHLGNCIYQTNINTSLLIDFATATHISKERHENHINKRNRKFDSFDFINNVYPQETSYVSPMILRKEEKSVNCSDIMKCGYIHSMFEFEKDELSRWNDIGTKKPNNIIHKTSYKYIPLSHMNEIDKESVRRGQQIYNFLKNFSSNENDSYLTLLQNYVSKNNLYFPCLTILDIPKLCIESISSNEEEMPIKGGRKLKTVKKYKKKFKSKSKAKEQKGGFYPSIYSGVSTALYAAPLAIKQGYRLWNSRKTRKNK